MYLTHTLILAAIPAISAFIGTTQVGWVIGNRPPVMLTQESALWMTIMSYLAMLSGVAVMGARSEEHTSELQSLMRISYAVFCLKKKTQSHNAQNNNRTQ